MWTTRFICHQLIDLIAVPSCVAIKKTMKLRLSRVISSGFALAAQVYALTFFQNSRHLCGLKLLVATERSAISPVTYVGCTTTRALCDLTTVLVLIASNESASWSRQLFVLVTNNKSSLWSRQFFRVGPPSKTALWSPQFFFFTGHTYSSI